MQIDGGLALYLSRTHGFVTFRGWGLAAKDTKHAPLLFSERQRKVRGRRLGRLYVKILTPTR
tara:strand:- start:800 stop:985 length:186 start_codon:yes stop_codon:yes gene_type:complete